MTSPVAACPNFIGGRAVASQSTELLDVTNPASGEVIARLPLSTEGEVDEAVASARKAAVQWGQTPPMQRARVLFRFNEVLRQHAEELTELVVIDNGKTLEEAKGSVQRGIESVEYACAIVTHTMGTLVEDVARGVDCEMFRQPLGVVAGFAPFNFPFMVPMWTIPLAVACGNAYVLKPSERTPLAANRTAELFANCGAPKGTLNIVHGAADVAEALMAHPAVQAVSVVGSSPVAKHVYTTAAGNGKRVQALGGAKNSLIVMPDVHLGPAVESIIGAVFGCAGQRCLAGANVVAVGEIAEPLLEALTAAAKALVLGSGLDPETTLGPVISAAAKERTIDYIEGGVRDGARLVLDGRKASVSHLPGGYFLGPTIFDEVTLDMAIARDEIFGPVLTVLRAPDLDSAIEIASSGPFGNSASIYTTNGGSARHFRRHVQAGMLGVNLGVPAPVPFFPFSGWKGSFFGDLHVQGRDGIEFYTRRKVVTSRWP